MQQDNRPLSPHLQVYKLPLAAKMSILHRATGVASATGLLLITWWLAMAASGIDSWRTANAIMSNPFVVIILFFWSATLIYHFCNGIRHLTWDIGQGLNKHGVRKSGYIALGCAGVLTVALWLGIWL